MTTVFINAHMVTPIFAIICSKAINNIIDITNTATPSQQHDGVRGPDQLVVKGKELGEKCEEQQPVETTDGDTNDKIYVQSILYCLL